MHRVDRILEELKLTKC